MAKPELGSKRQCQSCATKFFDFNRDPIVCPKCGAVFQALPVRASRAAAAADDDEAETAGPELVSLDEAETADEKAVDTGDDIEIEDDDSAADDDAFLEEEEDGDDVSDLIDGDIETDDDT